MSDDTSSPESAESPLAAAGDVRLLLSTAPAGQARKVARKLVEERLAACVNLVPGLRSVYRWQGAVQDEPETLLLIKTATGCLDALARRLREVHPYQTPELLTFGPESGLESYLQWVRKETQPAD